MYIKKNPSYIKHIKQYPDVLLATFIKIKFNHRSFYFFSLFSKKTSFLNLALTKPTAATSNKKQAPAKISLKLFTSESQNGRGWKGPLGVTQPNPLPKQGHPEQVAQDLVQAGLEYLQRRRLHSLPEQIWTWLSPTSNLEQILFE